jgi:hypothetical protein
MAMTGIAALYHGFNSPGEAMMIRTTLAISCALLGVAVTASADDIVRRAGEWQVTMQNGPMGQMTQKVCFATDQTAAQLSALKGPMKNCTAGNVSTSGNSLTMEATCPGPNNGKVTVHAVVTQTAPDTFHTESTMHMDGAPQGMPADMTMTTDGKRLGPCQPGDKQVE